MPRRLGLKLDKIAHRDAVCYLQTSRHGGSAALAGNGNHQSSVGYTNARAVVSCLSSRDISRELASRPWWQSEREVHISRRYKTKIRFFLEGVGGGGS